MWQINSIFTYLFNLFVYLSRSASLHSLLHKLDEASDAREFRYDSKFGLEMSGSRTPTYRLSQAFVSWACAI